MVRVVIRKPFHAYLQSMAASLGIDDLGEVVNMIVLDHMRVQPSHANLPPIQDQETEPDQNLEDLAGLL
jgi:hypothetical protein